MGEYFGDVLKRALSRREVLKSAIFGSAGLALVACGGGGGSLAEATQPPLSFKTIYPNTEDKITVPEGYKHNVVIRWGDALDSGPNLNWDSIYQNGPTDQDIERQKNCFGYNCDFLGFFKTPNGKILLAINHEYANPELMFSNFLDAQGNPNSGRPTANESRFMLEAHGVSIVEVRRRPDGSWEYVKGSSYNRRITGSTEIDISGPARGHSLMKTSQEPTGTKVLGTLNNCAGGKTPWGTMLTCEENFNSYFYGDINQVQDPTVKAIHQKYGVPSGYSKYYGFHNIDSRFNINQEPNEAFRFGWVVEIDPMDPSKKPVKRTALGRFKHEGATCVVAPNGRVVVYMGDDERFQYVYKFITKGTYNPNNRDANWGLLDEGELYVAKFNDNLTGQWMLIARCEKNLNGTYQITPTPALPQEFQNDPALCFINTRGAADALGATKMDRPEDVEWNPMSKSVWVALTYNERRGQSGQPPADASNPRSPNYMGHILEIMEDNQNPASTTFRWQIPVLCGDPNSPIIDNRLIIYGQFANSQVPAISAPDNFVIDKLGNVWIATDGNPSSSRLNKNDGVYVLNPFTKELKMFLSGVKGCEICGPEFSDDWKTFFCNIQHPGETDTNNPSSRWPYDGSANVPRPSTIAVWRTDGREIFA